MYKNVAKAAAITGIVLGVITIIVSSILWSFLKNIDYTNISIFDNYHITRPLTYEEWQKILSTIFFIIIVVNIVQIAFIIVSIVCLVLYSKKDFNSSKPLILLIILSFFSNIIVFIISVVALALKYKDERHIPSFNIKQILQKLNKNKKQLLINNALILCLAAFIICVIIINPSFLSLKSISRLVDRVASSILMALGMASIMIIGCTDLSAGRLSGLTAIISASLMQMSGASQAIFVGIHDVPFIVPLLASIIIGALFGAINAILVIKFRIHSFILTLSTSMILYSFMYWLLKRGTNGGKSVTVDTTSIYWKVLNASFSIGNANFHYYPFFIIGIVVAVWFFWNRTKTGMHMYAIGCNKDAATLNGVNILVTTLIVFAVAGALFGITGFLNGTGSSNQNSGYGLELDAIASCIIGGVSFAGGVGRIRGVIFGVVMMQLVAQSFASLTFIDSEYRQLVTGLIIIIAVGVDMQKNKVLK